MCGINPKTSPCEPDLTPNHTQNCNEYVSHVFHMCFTFVSLLFHTCFTLVLQICDDNMIHWPKSIDDLCSQTVLSCTRNCNFRVYIRFALMTIKRATVTSVRRVAGELPANCRRIAGELPANDTQKWLENGQRAPHMRIMTVSSECRMFRKQIWPTWSTVEPQMHAMRNPIVI